MRRLIYFIITAFLFLFSVRFAHAQIFSEHIRDFRVNIQVNKDGTMDVTENILYDFATLERHGIFRTIPYIKTNQDGKKYVLKINVASVKDENGRKHKYDTSRENQAIKLKIGDPDRYVTGTKTYIISYKVSGALTYFSDHDELYWNALGTEWTVPIASSTVNITLPQATDSSQIKVVCYTGSSGSTQSDCTAGNSNLSAQFSTTRFLGIGEGMTVAFGFPKGVVEVLEPKPYVPFSETWYGRIIIAFIVMIVGLLLLFWYVVYPLKIIYKWFRYGRDPIAPYGPVSSWFDPPKTKSGRELTPAESGSLVDETVHQRDISAIIVDLARRGYLKIEERKKNDFYFHKKKEYEGDYNLQPFERKLLKGIFGSSKEVRIKDKKLYDTVESVKKDIYEILVTEGFFPKNPASIRAFYIGIVVAAFSTLNIPLAIIALIFGNLMPAKTVFGVQSANVVKSLRNFLTSQERQLKFQAKHQYWFEKLLPYAVAFGVENIWAERFKDLHLKQPEWYSSYQSGHFSSTSFNRSLNSSFASVTRAATPTSSSTGHSSGFSGGSSGGGGGGGGGGSW